MVAVLAGTRRPSVFTIHRRPTARTLLSDSARDRLARASDSWLASRQAANESTSNDFAGGWRRGQP